MDFEYLKNKIIDAGEIAFRKIKADFKGHRFYFFGLFTSGEYSYLYPTCSSYEGLEQVANEYKKDDYYKEKSIKFLQKDLKWSPCDSPLHLVGEEYFECLDGDMNAVFEELDALYNPDDCSKFNEYAQKVEYCVVSAMKELDCRGVFGNKDNRSEILINFVMGDQSDEDRIRLAGLLNTVKQVELYKRELTI